MSLINDALKKAQKQRTGEAPTLANMPGLGGESASRIAKRAKPAGFNSLLLRLGLGAGAVAILAIGGWIALAPSQQEIAKPAPAAPRPEVAQTTQPAAPTATTTPPADQPAATAPAFTLPVTPKPEPAAVKPEPKPETGNLKPEGLESNSGLKSVAPVGPAKDAQVSGLKSQVSATSATTAPVATPPATSAPAVSGPAAKLGNKEITYIENLRIAGIRASTTDSKVLMNDRVYRLGDIVEREMGLKLVGITSGSLTFENESGARYTRTF